MDRGGWVGDVATDGAAGLSPPMLHALLFGLCLPFVVRMNESLSRVIGHLPGAWAVHATGAVFGAALLLPFAGRQWVGTVTAAPWWSWLGGIIGCAMVVLATRGVSTLGIASFTALTVAIQLVVSAGIDHFGWVGAEVHPLTLTRSAGIVLLGLGATLVVRG